MATCLVTGAAGYIGSHTLVALLEAGHEPVAVDNYCNSRPEALRRVARIAQRDFPIYEADIRDAREIGRVFTEHRIDTVIHFAGLKAISESLQEPLKYYENNLTSTFVLVEAMMKHRCFRLVFSSSATVYGDPKVLPILETGPLSAKSPYGRTKLVIEEMLRDLAHADERWQVALLRYFNPVGAHASGLIGEDPRGAPNNLFPYLAQVAIGRLPELRIFGHDYSTPDGTGVRDYIHVNDLARGHVHAVEHIASMVGAEALNLGTGRGTSVLEAIAAFEAASERRVPHVFAARRLGDVAACYADPSLARQRLKWESKYSLADMAADTWRWQKQNPFGYE